MVIENYVLMRGKACKQMGSLLLSLSNTSEPPPDFIKNNNIIIRHSHYCHSGLQFPLLFSRPTQSNQQQPNISSYHHHHHHQHTNKKQEQYQQNQQSTVEN